VRIDHDADHAYAAGAYFGLGVEHILFGYDHVLFVILLTLIATSIRSLLWAVSVFTLAHSITLIATAMNWVSLSIGPVEACIALSVALLAVKACQPQSDSPQLTRWLIVTCLCFGLLHGFGFAAALDEIGLPSQAKPMALFLFNLGVEAGQIAVVLVIVLLRTLYTAVAGTVSHRQRLIVPYLVGSLACFWFFERVGSILL
jgi:hydrogenase/urease accessory protein HupE